MQGLVCDKACKGCWSTGSTACQFCKDFKLDQTCIHSCGDGKLLNGRFTYLANPDTRECKYCHPECKNGCSGPVITFQLKSKNEINLITNFLIKDRI